MTHRYIEKMRLIERYLLNQLSDQEMRDFGAHLLGCERCKIKLVESEKALRIIHSVAHQDSGQVGDPLYPARPIIANLVNFPKKNSTLYLLRAAAVLLVIITATFLYLNPLQVQKQKLADKNITPASDSVAVLQQEIDRSFERVSDSLSKAAQAAQALAFATNPRLEDLMLTNFRADDQTVIESIEPRPDANYLSRSKPVHLSFQGRIKHVAWGDSATVILSILSNRKSDYVNAIFVSTDTLTVRPLEQPDCYGYDFKKSVKLKPGLYYYFMKTVDNNDPLKVGKFYIDRPAQL